MSRKTDRRIRHEITQLKKSNDGAINTLDIPEVFDLEGDEGGHFYRPVKRQITLPINADIPGWFLDHGPK